MDLEMPGTSGFTDGILEMLMGSDGRFDGRQTYTTRGNRWITRLQSRHCPQWVNCILSANSSLTREAGNARQGQIDEAKAAGMDDVVIKPYRLVSPVHLLSVNKANIQDDLLQKIENMMRIRASRNTIDAVSNSAVETPGEIEMGE